ncbi:short-chain dehydrogenase, partial [Burkholderia glumae]|nr:short-chain dehydrogenase [Burkholderia glumae]
MTASAVTSAAALPDARVVLITGAAPIPAGPAGPAGIGAALARAFARRGWDVALAVDAEAARP